MKKIITIVIITSALAGCATTAVPLSQSKPVPTDRVYVTYGQNSDGGRLVVTRDAGILGSGCTVGFYIDGKLAAKYESGEGASFPITTGEHIIGVGNPGGRGICAFNSDLRKESSTIVKQGDLKYFRIAVRQQGGVTLEPTTQTGN